MKKTISLLLLTTALTALPAWAQNAALVNGKPIPNTYLDAIVKEVVAQGQPDTPDLRNGIRDNLIMREILTQEAEKNKLDRQPDIRAQIEMNRKNILLRALMNDFAKKNPVTETELRKEYSDLVTLTGSSEYHARHILVEKEADAKAIIDSLNKGDDFAEIAKTRSIDGPTAPNGGDLGWAARTVYVDDFAKALSSLKKGEITQEPVKSTYGFHVIRLEDTRPLEIPKFEELKQVLEQRVQEQKWDAYTDSLRQKARVVIQ